MEKPTRDLKKPKRYCCKAMEDTLKHYDMVRYIREQGRQPRSEDQVLVDYLNAGTVTRYNDKVSLVTDIHGQTSLLANHFLPEALTSPDKLLVETDLDPGRVLNLRRNHCVRLITDAYEDRGLPRGIEGYVTNLVSTEALGWSANNCQIMVVLEYLGKDIPWSEDFLEVDESELERCTKENPPSDWFPFETSEDGLVKTTPLGFKVKPDAKTYTYEELIIHLMGKPPTWAEQPSGSPREGASTSITRAPETPPTKG